MKVFRHVIPLIVAFLAMLIVTNGGEKAIGGFLSGLVVGAICEHFLGGEE